MNKSKPKKKENLDLLYTRYVVMMINYQNTTIESSQPAKKYNHGDLEKIIKNMSLNSSDKKLRIDSIKIMDQNRFEEVLLKIVEKDEDYEVQKEAALKVDFAKYKNEAIKIATSKTRHINVRLQALDSLNADGLSILFSKEGWDRKYPQSIKVRIIKKLDPILVRHQMIIKKILDDPFECKNLKYQIITNLEPRHLSQAFILKKVILNSPDPKARILAIKQINQSDSFVKPEDLKHLIDRNAKTEVLTELIKIFPVNDKTRKHIYKLLKHPENNIRLEITKKIPIKENVFLSIACHDKDDQVAIAAIQKCIVRNRYMQETLKSIASFNKKTEIMYTFSKPVVLEALKKLNKSGYLDAELAINTALNGEYIEQRHYAIDCLNPDLENERRTLWLILDKNKEEHITNHVLRKLAQSKNKSFSFIEKGKIKNLLINHPSKQVREFTVRLLNL